MDPVYKKNLEKQGYRLIESHSAIKICSWTKNSLIDEGTCYKQQFYNIKTHQCCQMTPCMVCNNECVFCWRDQTAMYKDWQKHIDNPQKIIEGCIKNQKKLLNGFLGHPRINLKRFKEAQNITQWALSLTGEPTLYPKLNELLRLIRERGNTSFLVTNGTTPEILNRIEMPTQLYVSLDAPNEELYHQIDKPKNKNSWKKLNETLELLPSLKTRKVIRITAIKNLNMTDIQGYASLIKKAQPDFIEVKGFMLIGFSKQRLEPNNMPTHEEVKGFSLELADELGMQLIDESERSRVVLIAVEDTPHRKFKD